MASVDTHISADWELAGSTLGEAPHRRILVAVDQGDKDDATLRYAAALASKSGAAVRVIHITAREVYGGRRYALEGADEAAALVDGALSDLRVAGVAASGSVRITLLGHEGENIVAEATEWGADAIVLGAGPRRSWRRLFARSIREQVLRFSQIPVIVAPPASSLKRTSHIDTETARQQRAA